MNIKKYDDKFISLTNTEGEIFEGLCMHNGAEYNEHEYGVNEESIVIQYIMFYKSQIKKIKKLKENKTPYSPFTEAYGLLEKIIIDSGPDIIDEVFDSENPEDNIHIYRLLLAINDYIRKDLIKEKDKEEIIKLTERLIKYNKDENVLQEAKYLLKNQ